MTPRCPDCAAYVRVTYRGVTPSKNPWVGWDPVVRGECHRHGEVAPVDWDWESVFGDWDPDEAAALAAEGVTP